MNVDPDRWQRIQDIFDMAVGIEQISVEELRRFFDSLPAAQDTVSERLDFLEDETLRP